MRRILVALLKTVASFTILLFIFSIKNEKSESKKEINISGTTIIILFIIFFISLSIRIFYIAKSYPLVLGWDTPGYIRESMWFTQGVPIKYPNNVPFGKYPLFYMMGAVFYSLFNFSHIIPIFISIIDTFSIFSLYLLLKKVVNDKEISLISVLIYSLSYF